jgi:hypothetical protein
MTEALLANPFSRSAPSFNSTVAAVRPALLVGELKNDIRFRDAVDQPLFAVYEFALTSAATVTSIGSR